MSRESAYNKKQARAKADAQQRHRRATGHDAATSASSSMAKPSKELQRTQAMFENPHPYRYQSFNDRLAAVRIAPGTSLTSGRGDTLAGLDVQGVAPAQPANLADLDDEDDEDVRMAILQASTAFGSALMTWRELNLSVPFQGLLRQIQYNSQSLPLLIHHRTHIASHLSQTLRARGGDTYLAYEPALDLFPRLALDLGSEFMPVYTTALSSILQMTTINKNQTAGDEAMAARLVEKGFESMAALFRNLAQLIVKEAEGEVDWLLETWKIVRPYLGGKAEEAVAIQPMDIDQDPGAEASTSTLPTAAAPRIASHVRRFAAEAFAHLLRRSKQGQLRKTGCSMVADIDEMLDQSTSQSKAVAFASGVAGIWLEVVKSVDRRLHSQAVPQLQALLSEEDHKEARSIVGKLLFTALVHHGQSAHLVPMFEMLLGWADAALEKQDLERLAQVVSWLSTAVGTRKGNRVDDTIKTRLFALEYKLQSEVIGQPTAPAALNANVITLYSLSLPIGRIPDLIGQGIKIVDALAHRQDLTREFHTLSLTLADPDLSWSGYKQFVLPSVLAVTASAMNDATSADAAFLLLSQLSQLGQLESLSSEQTPAVAKWRRAVATGIKSRVARLAKFPSSPESPEDELARLLPCLEIVPLFATNEAASDIASSLRLAITTLLGQLQGPHEDLQASRALDIPSLLAASALALARLLEASTSSPQKLARDVCSPDLAQTTIELCSQRRYTLDSVLRLFKAAGASYDASPLAQHLWSGLMSSDEGLRRASSGWLSLGGSSELYSQIDTIESIPLSVETIRDRNVRLTAVVRELVKQASDGKASSDVAATVCRWLIGTLKLNLKPLWEDARKGLAELSARFGEEIWSVAFAELASRPASVTQVQPLAERSSDEHDLPSLDVLPPEGDEHDKAFRDPQRYSRVQGIAQIWSDASRSVSHQAQASLLALQAPAGRLDIANYQSQILLLFSEVPSMVEKRNAPFVQHFFDVVVDDDAQRRGSGADPSEEDDEDNDARGDKPGMTVRERQERLLSYLKVFARFSNPKALYRSQEVHAYLYSLAAQGEVRIQKMALECVLTWKNSVQMAYQERMERLLDQAKFRDELTSFDLSVEGGAIQPQDREALMPLLLRLLFGQIISRKGRTSASTSGAGRRVAVLNALSGCSSDELGIIVELMLASFADQKAVFQDGKLVVSQQPPLAYLRQQNGFLSLLADVIKHLGAQLLPHWPSLVGVTVNLAHHGATRAAMEGPGKSSAQSRELRQAAIRRLGGFFKSPVGGDFEWSAYLPVIFSSLVSPRLPTFASENVQSPSALLDLLHIWAQRESTLPLLVEGDDRVLESIYSCLAAPTVKPVVVTSILDIVDRIIDASDENEKIVSNILRRYLPTLLANLAPLLQRSSSAAQGDPLLQREIQILARLAPFVERSEDATVVLELLGPMMRKSNRVVPEKSKTDLLATFKDLLLLTDTFKDPESEIFTRHYDLFCSLWSTLRSRSARVTLGNVFSQVAQIDPSLSQLATWVNGLNAWSERRLDEVDFDKRLDVFDTLTSEEKPLSLSIRYWQALVHNMLFFIQDGEELVLRTNASAVLRRFVACVAEESSQDGPLRMLFVRTVYPGLRKTLRARSELVRREVLSVIGSAVKQLPAVDALSEMQGLLAGGDEEANFFNNIHHLQLHRRARALRRLADHADTGALKSKTIAEVFLPLIAHFLEAGHTEIGDHNLMNETIQCIGRLARYLRWGSYNSVLWKYLRGADTKGASEKVFVRAAMAVLDNFHFAMDKTINSDDVEEEDKEQDEANGQEDRPATDGQDAATAPAPPLEDNVKIVSSVTSKLLPALMGYLEHHDDETDDAIRLPIAVGVVRVVECLPEADKEVQLGKLLNVLSNVFRSKAQETRDLARETLCKVAVNLGQDRLPQIVKEMRRALTRGPQLAILAYNVHGVLVHLMDHASLTLLDRGVDEIVAIAAEDLFGATGEDRETVEYKTKVKEMRQSKSLDTYERLASIVAPHRINSLLTPLKQIMEQTETPRSMRAVEDALRRMANGINSNPHFRYDSFLSLCHSLVSQNAAFLKQRAQAENKTKSASSSGMDSVLLKRKDVENAKGQKDHYTANAYRFVSFGLDLLVVALRRARFDFQDKEILGRLDPLVAAVGNTLYAADTQVVTLALRAAGGLLRCPLPSLQASLPVMVRQILSIINREANPAAETSQAGLRTLTIILRDHQEIPFKEKQLADLLDLTVPEIEEPAAQSSIFALLRAIIARRFVVSEVYEVMDKVAEMMVTNQSSQVREISRATYLQFLLDYPQGKGRLRNQIEFLAKNLSYVYESGRLSVLELLTAILAKFSDQVLKDYAELLFVALVMVLANDDSTKCRERAASLVKALFGLAEETQKMQLINMAHSWVEGERAELSRVGLQVYSLLLDIADQPETSWLNKAMKNTRQALLRCADELEAVEQDDDTFMDLDLDWQMPYHALQVVNKLHKVDATLVTAETWVAVRRLLLFPHSWVRTSSCRLLGSLFGSSEIVAPPQTSSKDPVSLVSLIETARKLALQLRGEAVDEALSLQILKNLLWIGKCFAKAKVLDQRKSSTNDDGDEDAADSEQEGDDDDEDEGKADTGDADAQENPLAWLFTKLSFQSRNLQGGRATPDNPAGLTIVSTSAILRWFAAMAQHLSRERIVTFLPHMVTPLFRLMDDETLRGGQIDTVKSLASEVQELLTEVVTPTVYAGVFSRVRSKAIERRQKRRTDRLMQGVLEPEKAAKRKQKRNEGKHESRKRKNQVFADGKLRVKPLKRHRV